MKPALAATLLALLLLPARPLAADGAEVWRRKCAGCHGADGSGGPRRLAPIAGPELQAKTDAQLFEVVAQGVSAPDRRMPAFRGKLADAEIAAAVAWLRTLKR